MGTLFKQSPRNGHYCYNEEAIIKEIDKLKRIAVKTDISYADAVKTVKVLELRRSNDLYLSNGDTFDEQIAGIGEILKDFTDAYINNNT